MLSTFILIVLLVLVCFQQSQAEKNLLKLRSLRQMMTREDLPADASPASTPPAADAGASSADASSDAGASSAGASSADAAAAADTTTAADADAAEENTNSAGPISKILDNALEATLSPVLDDQALQALVEEGTHGDPRAERLVQKIKDAKQALEESTEDHLKNVKGFELLKDRISQLLRLLRGKAHDLRLSQGAVQQNTKVLDTLLRERRLLGMRDQFAHMVLDKKIASENQAGAISSNVAIDAAIKSLALDIQKVGNGEDLSPSIAQTIGLDTSILSQAGLSLPSGSTAPVPPSAEPAPPSAETPPSAAETPAE